MTRLINADVLKQYIDDCKVCDNCTEKKFMCSVGCTFPDNYSPIWERVLNEQPTVEAIPIEYMQSQVDCGKWQEIIQRWREHETD